MKLSPRHRQIVVLVGRDGCTYQEIADALGISLHTVHAHVKVICDRHRQREVRPQAVMARLYWTVLHPATDGDSPGMVTTEQD